MLLAIIGVYLFATLVVGVVFSTRIKRASDYLLAGRDLGLALTIASLAAVQRRGPSWGSGRVVCLP